MRDVRLNVSQKLIRSHLVSGSLEPGAEVAITIDQTLAPDSTGTLIALELEAMGIKHTHASVSVQYVDHNLVQEDHKNPDDHRFLLSAARRFGLWYSRPGNGVSHARHMERFGRPGDTLLGADSHTPAAGSLGMLAVGAGGLDVALAIAGEPFHMTMPDIWGIRLVGQLPEWVSAKDVILEVLRRHGVRAGVGRIIEYHGPGLQQLSAMDRHVIANMGAELGATTSVFPSDQSTRRFLASQQRTEDWVELTSDRGASYDISEEIDLSDLEPLVALPPSPGNVVPVSEVAGEVIHQAYIGSSANPGYRDLAIASRIVSGRRIPAGVSLDINPASRQVLLNLIADGHLKDLVQAGARLHQAGCNGCVGMGQAPATDTISLRTVPRNFPGRSGTTEDKVYLVSPETAAVSALCGRITDPRSAEVTYPVVTEPDRPILDADLFEPPPELPEARAELEIGPNIVPLPLFDPPPDPLEITVGLVVGDDVSTDEIMPAGSRVLPFRSNIPRMADFVFADLDPEYSSRVRTFGDHAIVAGHNYGQGSSREHAALVPRFLGLRLVLAADFARIHLTNLVNFGVIPLSLGADTPPLVVGDRLTIRDPISQLHGGEDVVVEHDDGTFVTHHSLTGRDIAIIRSGGIMNSIRARHDGSSTLT